MYLLGIDLGLHFFLRVELLEPLFQLFFFHLFEIFDQLVVLLVLHPYQLYTRNARSSGRV